MRYLRFTLLGLVMPAAIVAAGVLFAPWPGAQASVDSDGDGYDDATEAYLGTDPLSDCGPVSGTDAWPPDLDNNGFIDNFDRAFLLFPNFGSRQGQPGFQEREDLNRDGINGILDVAHLTGPMFLTTCPDPYVPPTPAGSISEIAVDTDTSGNGPRLLGTIQNCSQIDSGGTNTIDIDVVLPSPGVHADDGIKGWEFLLNYDPAVVTVSAEDCNFLLTQAEGSDFLEASDLLPDMGGSWRSGGFDYAFSPFPEPVGAHEVGPGVLTRITLTGVAEGTSALTLTKVGAMTAANGAIPIVTLSNAWVSVDEVDSDCVPDGSDNCPDDYNPGQENNVHPGTPEGDHCEDPDGDGFTDAAENYVGTDPNVACGPNAWPPDTDGNGVGNGFVGNLDFLIIVDPANWLQFVPPANPRADIYDDNGFVGNLDFLPIVEPGKWLQSCT